MKVHGFYIEGFGIFNEIEFSSLSPKVTIVQGPNESGKTTLLAFLRRMIFGFPRKKKGVNLYEPLNGGVMGGRLYIESREGDQYTLQRISGNKAPLILLPDNSQADIPISRLIGSADQSFFENVFAFGMDELQSFDSLSAESIQSHLMSAGVGITKIPIPDVQKKLTEDVRNLYFKGERGAPIISKKIEDVKTLESKLHSFSKTNTEYDRCYEEREGIEKELTQIREERTQVGKEIKIKENILSVRDDWNAYCQATQGLSELPKLESFPQKGIDRLESLNEKIEELSSKQSEKDIEYQQNAQNIRATAIDDRILAQAKAIQKLEREKDRYLSDLQGVRDLKQQCSADHKDLEDLIRSIRREWTEENLLSFDISSSAKSQVDAFKNDFELYEKKIWELNTPREELIRRIPILREQIKSLKGKIPEHVEVISDEQLKERRDALDYLAVYVPKLEKKKIEYDHLAQREAELGTGFQQRVALIQPEIPIWPASVIVVAGVISLIAGLLQGSTLVGSVIFILLTFVALIYVRSAKKVQGEVASDPVAAPQEDIMSMAQLRHDKEVEIRNLEKEILERATFCGFSAIPDNAMIPVRRREVEEVSRSVDERNKLYQEIDEKENELKASEADLQEKDEEIQVLQNDLEILTKKWQKWLTSAGLDTTLSPAVVYDIFSTAKEARLKLDSIAQNGKRLADLSKKVLDFETEVKATLEACEMVPSGSYDADVYALAVSLKDNEKIKARLETLQGEQSRLEVELKGLNEQITKKNEERNQLFRSGFAEDEEGFRHNGEIWNQRIAYTTAIDNAESRLKRAAGRVEKYPEFVETLKSSDFLAISQDKDQLVQRQSEIEEESNALHVRLGELNKILEELENDDAALVIRNKREGILKDIHVDSRFWTKLTLAQYILGKAIERYERERQPAVYQQAQGYFSAITDGKYRRILKPIDSSEILVEDKGGKRLDTLSLSRGTTEQLYLALRFGYISEFIKHDEPLPVIFDDILVNFDPERKRNSCEAISRLAESNQVIFFTCHPETVDALLETSPEAKVIDLENDL